MLVCNNTKLGFTSQVNNESAIRFYQNFDDGENENWTWRNRICYSDV